MSKQLSKNILQPPYNFNEVWEELLESKDFVKVFLSEVLEAYILKQRWYGGKASKLKYIELSEYFKIKQGDEVYYGLILEINFFHNKFGQEGIFSPSLLVTVPIQAPRNPKAASSQSIRWVYHKITMRYNIFS